MGALIALSVVAVYVGLLLRWPADRPVAYWLVDDSTLGVVVLDSPNLTCGVASVEESGDAVRIHAQCGERVIPVPQAGLAQQYVFNVSLRAPLGSRAVVDGSGSPAQLCLRPAPDCWYS
jgi:hypothetical protein